MYFLRVGLVHPVEPQKRLEAIESVALSAQIDGVGATGALAYHAKNGRVAVPVIQALADQRGTCAMGRAQHPE